MRSSALVTLLAVGLLASPALAQEGDLERDEYPMELVRRPLVLAPKMFEVRLGGASDFMADSPADQVRSRFDLLYAPFRRAQVGLETDLFVAGDNAFQVGDVAAWFEYGVHPTMSLRAGGYMQAFHDPVNDELGDPLWGVRVGAPMRWRVGAKAAVVAQPRWGMEVSSDDKPQRIDLPLGFEFQLIPQIGWFARAGIGIVDFEIDDASKVDVPVATGLVIHIARRFDLGAEVLVSDVSESAGRDLRWLSAWMAYRR